MCARARGRGLAVGVGAGGRRPGRQQRPEVEVGVESDLGGGGNVVCCGIGWSDA